MTIESGRGDSLSDLSGGDGLEPIPLGPFELYERIGAGAMGEVWRGRHVKQDVAAAIKVISRDEALEKRFQFAFRNEVRSIAALNHPGVARVFDYGTVTDEADYLSGGELRAGSPYMAMELAAYGSLDQVERRGWSWAKIRPILLSLLDALSHSHARGVIHRDIKPGNILLTTPEDGWSGIKLADFGLAFLMERLDGQSSSGFAGTPHYMAPEQLLGRWRDNGPWTDLYALGCLAFELCAGRKPFDGDNVFQIARAHLNDPVPSLGDCEALPEGFASWLEGMLTKDHRRRFQNAADAAHGLLMMDKEASQMARDDLSHLWGRPLSEGTTAESPSNSVMSLSPIYALAGLSRNVSQEGPEVLTEAHKAPGFPIPERGQRPLVHTTSIRLIGAGLGLYGMRRTPMVGREAEQDILWQKLRECDRDKGARVVLLHGPAGVGKDYLAQWLAERALELGSASVLRGSYSSTASATEGLAGMLARYLGCIGLTRDEVRERVEEVFRSQGVTEAYEWLALAEIIAPSAEDDASRIAFQSSTQRYVLIQRLLSRQGRVRPVILWLSDVHWGSDGIALARYLLEHLEEELPVLVVMTAREDLVVEIPEVQEGLAFLDAHGGFEQVSLGPLDTLATREFVKDLFFLDEYLATQVAQRTQGNPLFASRLVGDWIDRGVLEVGEVGFQLSPKAKTHFPDDLFEVWAAPMRHLLEGFTPEDQLGLELAATLGQFVDWAEWSALCAAAGVVVPEELIDAMSRRRLTYLRKTGWSFAHTMLQETLLRLAREHERLKSHHQLCAAMLATGAKGDPFRAERQGHHLLEAGLFEEAIEPLFEAALHHHRTRDLVTSTHLLRRREQAMEVIDVPGGDRHWIRGYNLLAKNRTLSGTPREGTVLAQKAFDAATALGDKELLAEAHISLGLSMLMAGQIHEVRTIFEGAGVLFDELGDKRHWGISQRLIGRIFLHQQEFDEARLFLLKARQVLEEDADAGIELAHTVFELGLLERSQRNLDDARTCFEQAMGAAQGAQHQGALADCWMALGDIARDVGDLHGARSCYSKGLSHGRYIGQGRVLVPRLNLALTDLAAGNITAAREEFERCLILARQAGRTLMEGYTSIIMLPTLVPVQAWSLWDERFERGQHILRERKSADPDVLRTLRLTARLCAEAGEVERAQRASDFADELE